MEPGSVVYYTKLWKTQGIIEATVVESDLADTHRRIAVEGVVTTVAVKHLHGSQSEAFAVVQDKAREQIKRYELDIAALKITWGLGETA